MRIQTLILLISITLFSSKLTAQYKLDTHGGPLIVWDNSKTFKGASRLKPLDWSTYARTWDGKLYVTWLAYAGAGVCHGMREAYHADPYVYEREWNVGNESFAGSDAYKRAYFGRNPDGKHRSELLGNVGYDIWHTAGATSKGLMFTATLGIGIRKQPIKYKILNALVGYGIQSVFASMTYSSLRN